MAKEKHKLIVTDKSFNKEYAKSVTKEEFIKQHEHLKDSVNLGKTYDELKK